MWGLVNRGILLALQQGRLLQGSLGLLPQGCCCSGAADADAAAAGVLPQGCSCSSVAAEAVGPLGGDSLEAMKAVDPAFLGSPSLLLLLVMLLLLMARLLLLLPSC